METRCISIKVHPIDTEFDGTIEVPFGINDDELMDYIRDNFDKVDFGNLYMDPDEVCIEIEDDYIDEY